MIRWLINLPQMFTESSSLQTFFNLTRTNWVRNFAPPCSLKFRKGIAKRLRYRMICFRIQQYRIIPLIQIDASSNILVNLLRGMSWFDAPRRPNEFEAAALHLSVMRRTPTRASPTAAIPFLMIRATSRCSSCARLLIDHFARYAEEATS